MSAPVPAMTPGDLAEMPEAERQALPARYHQPHWDGLGYPHSWICQACWGEGWQTSWPCEKATVGGKEVAEAAGFELLVVTPDPIPDAQLAEWRALADAATPGPWEVGQMSPGTIDGRATTWEVGNEAYLRAGDGPMFCAEVYDDQPYDAEFIAAARSAVPKLLAEVERLKGGRDRIGKAVLQAIKDLTPAADANEAGYRAAWAAGMVEAMFLAKQALDGAE